MKLMESPIQSKRIGRKRKKSKTSKCGDDNKTVVKPECFDGMTNWLILQKTLGSTKKKDSENSKKPVIRKSFNRSQKKQRLSECKAEMSAHGHRKFNSKDKNDSGCISSSDLSPGPSNDKTKSNTTAIKCEEDINADDYDLNQLTKVLAIDCEMVGTGPEGKDSILARVSIVNSYGQCVYDEFVKPKEMVTDFRTHISGVRPSDLKKGKDLYEVQQDVSAMMEGRKIVGHDLKHDFDVLFISHPRSLIRDTSKYKPFREICGGKTPSLKKLTSIILGCNIQSGEHSSIEDAQASMLLYLRHKKDWERHLKALRKRKPAK